MVETSSTGGLAELSDDSLMERCARDDTAAFSELVARYERQVVALCRHLVNHPDLVEEAAQEAFVELWVLRRAYVPRSRFRSYLFQISLNSCRRQRRSWWRWQRRNDAFAESCSTAHTSSPQTLEQIELQRDRGRLAQAIAKLPRPQREALTLRYFSEMSYEEIASTTGASESTLRSRVQLAQQRLCRSLRITAERDER